MKIRMIFLILFLIIHNGVIPNTITAAEGKNRNFLVIFDIREYTPMLEDSVAVLFNQVMQKGDQLIVATPRRLISYSQKKLDEPKEILLKSLSNLLREDIITASAAYRMTIAEMMRNVDNPYERSVLKNYEHLRKKLLALKGNYEEQFIKYANMFRRVEGENHIMMIFQQEFRPIPNKEKMEELRGSVIASDAVDAFLSEYQQELYNQKKILIAFRFANIRFHFLYLKEKSPQKAENIGFVENSTILYEFFSTLSTATGGIKLTSSKPEILMKECGKNLVGTVEVEVIDEKME